MSSDFRSSFPSSLKDSMEFKLATLWLECLILEDNLSLLELEKRLEGSLFCGGSRCGSGKDEIVVSLANASARAASRAVSEGSGETE